MSYVGKVKKGSTTHLVGSTLYGTCATAAGTAAKVVTCSDFDVLFTGVTIHVKMTNSNTAGATTLNVNGTGAKGVRTFTGLNRCFWYAGQVVSFTYDGTYWLMNDGMTLAQPLSGTATGTSASSATLVTLKKDLFTIPFDGFIIGVCQFQWMTNATGDRMAHPAVFNSSGTQVSSMWGLRTPAPSSNPWIMEVPFFHQVAEGYTFGVNGNQTSGTSLRWDVNMYGYLFRNGKLY